MKKGSLFILRFISIFLLIIVSIILFAILTPISFIWNILENVIDETLTPNRMVEFVIKQINITEHLLKM